MNPYNEPLLSAKKKREVLTFVEILLAQDYTPNEVRDSFEGDPQLERDYAFEKAADATGHPDKSLPRKGRRNLQKKYKRLFKKNPSLKPKKGSQ